MKVPSGVQIATLTRLWNAAQSLARIRAAAQPARESQNRPSAWMEHSAGAEDPPLWGAYAFRILDVRPAPLFGMRHIPDAGSLPADEIAGRVHELPPKGRDLVVVAEDPADAFAVTGAVRERGWLGSVPLIEPLGDWPGPWESGPAHRILWEPSPLVRRWAAQIPRGRIADLGCGSGRDAVYLALRGGDVIAVDRLPDALAMARRLAERMGVELHTHERDLRQEPPAIAEPLAAILMVRFQQRALFPWVRQALAPGGLLLLETFAREVADPVPQPAARKAPRTALAPQEALAAFAGPGAGSADGAGGFDILEYAETTNAAGEAMVRLVARRRGS